MHHEVQFSICGKSGQRSDFPKFANFFDTFLFKESFKLRAELFACFETKLYYFIICFWFTLPLSHLLFSFSLYKLQSI